MFVIGIQLPALAYIAHYISSTLSPDEVVVMAQFARMAAQ